MLWYLNLSTVEREGRGSEGGGSEGGWSEGGGEEVREEGERERDKRKGLNSHYTFATYQYEA